MNKEEIIALALEFGVREANSCDDDVVVFYESELLSFAEAIQDKQREEDAKICDIQDGMHDWVYSGAIRANKE